MTSDDLRVAAATLMAAGAQLDGLVRRLRTVLPDDAWAGPAATRFLDDLAHHAVACARAATAAREVADRLVVRSAADAVPVRAA